MIEKKKLEKIRAYMPSGSYAKIANETGFSEAYVSMVMRGERPVNASNIKIVKSAIRLVEVKAKELNKIIDKISKL